MSIWVGDGRLCRGQLQNYSPCFPFLLVLQSCWPFFVIIYTWCFFCAQVSGFLQTLLPLPGMPSLPTLIQLNLTSTANFCFSVTSSCVLRETFLDTPQNLHREAKSELLHFLSLIVFVRVCHYILTLFLNSSPSCPPSPCHGCNLGAGSGCVGHYLPSVLSTVPDTW